MSIVIKSFQWGQSNDRNAWQEGAFWNDKNINYRENRAYIELSKKAQTKFSIATSGISNISAITFWGTWGAITTDMVVFTSNGIYTSAWQQSLITDIVNVWQAISKKYFVTENDLYEFTTPSTNTLLDTLTRSVYTRPMVEFAGDLLIWDWNQIARWTWSAPILEYNGTLDVLGNLDGIVVSMTVVNQDVYVWCNNGADTNLYIWNGTWPDWQRKITYKDKAVQNVALLGNMHYWWQAKSHAWIREVLIWESFSPQVFVKSGFTEVSLTANPDNEKNKMAIATIYDSLISNTSILNINAIETASDIVYLPWIGRIFGFGKYFPWDKYSFNTEFAFTGTYVYAMASGGRTASWVDASGFLAFATVNGSAYDINIVNLGQDGDPTTPIHYASSWELESMEYVAPNYAKWEDDVKYVIDFELPSSACSIKVYEKRDRWSYSLVKILTYTDFPWHQLAEIATQGKWRRKQFKFELITTDPLVSPKLYTGFTNITQDTWKV